MRRLAIFLLAAVLVFYVGAGAFFYFQQDAMTFPAPAQYPRATPSDAGIAFEDLHIPVAGTDQVHAWWIPSTSSSASANFDKVVLMFHGNGYVIEQAVKYELIPLHQLGTNLLLVDYRGYGSSSPGTPNENRVYEDARAALNYLITWRHVPIHKIIFMGRSIGTGPATQLAMEHPEAGGLILESPFTSLPAAARGVWYLRAFPVSAVIHNKFDSLSKIRSVHVPVFITVGSEDLLTPPAMAKEIFAQANEPKKLYLVPNADHNGIVDAGGAALVSQMRNFITSVP